MPIGGKIPDLDHMFTIEEEVQWSKELAVSALHSTGECCNLLCCDIICTARLKLNFCAQGSVAVRRKS